MGNLIGENSVLCARRMAKLTYIQAISVASAYSLFMFVYREELPDLFTSEEEAFPVAITVSVIPILAIANLIDMSLSFFLGCIRALGLQAKTALVIIGCFYIISLPLASYLGFYLEYSVHGIWIGYFTGIAIQCAIVAYMTLSEDW